MKSEHERFEENHKKENGVNNANLEIVERIDDDAETSKLSGTPSYLRAFV